MEVIYTGLHQTPEQIAETVIQEDADAVGLSILSGAHMTLVPRVVELLKQQGVEDVLITVGGTIPAEDIPELKQLGVAEVFTPGAPTDDIVSFIRNGGKNLNPVDTHALEAAMQIKAGGAIPVEEVIAVTMGPDSAVRALHKAVALGADRSLHLADGALEGSDVCATGYALAKVLES